MAYSQAGMQVSYLYRDADSAEADAQAKLPASTTFADAETYAVTNLLPLLNALAPAPYAINITMRRTRNLAPAGGSGEGEKKGVFLIVNNARGKPTTKLAIPGIPDSVLQGDNKTIDQANANVQALLQAIINGKQVDGTTDIVTGISGCVSRRGNDFVSATVATTRAKRAYKYHVTSGKGVRRRSS